MAVIIQGQGVGDIVVGQHSFVGISHSDIPFMLEFWEARAHGVGCSNWRRQHIQNHVYKSHHTETTPEAVPNFDPCDMPFEEIELEAEAGHETARQEKGGLGALIEETKAHIFVRLLLLWFS